MSWPISSSFSCSNPSSTVSRTLPACHKPPDTPRHLAIVAPARRYLPQRHLPRTLAPTSPPRRRQDASPPARTSTKTLIPTNGTAILAPMGGGRGDDYIRLRLTLLMKYRRRQPIANRGEHHGVAAVDDLVERRRRREHRPRLRHDLGAARDLRQVQAHPGLRRAALGPLH